MTRARSMMALVIAAGLLASFAVASCGDPKATAPITPPPALGVNPNIISVDDVNKQPAGSPERTVLLWAQAIQFLDPRTVMKTYTPKAVAQGGAGRISAAVRGIGSTLGRPEFVQTTHSGPNRSRVRAYMVSYDAERRPTVRQPVTFDLVKTGSGWALDDPTLLLDTYRNVKIARGDRPSPSASAAAGSGGGA